MPSLTRNLGLLAALCALAGVLTAPTSASAATETFNHTGASQTWTVPYGVTSASFVVSGAQGRGSGGTFSGGLGGRASATFAVTPQAVVQVNVGGQGRANAGGFNGGGTAINGGGGATDLRRGGTALSDRVLIAGGGGGTSGCSNQAFAGGGGGSGFNGFAGSDPQCGATPGGGGTQTAGGSVGGTLGQGGSTATLSGGGGGGGYYGGGAGSGPGGFSPNGPGGGGSGYGPAGYGSAGGAQYGDGDMTVTYTQSVKNLSVAASGPGEGYVSSSPAGISCGNDGAHTDCGEDYGDGAPVTLTANPGPGSTFTGWSGACSGTTTCTVTMSQARSVQASFGNGPRTLSVSKPGNGSGSVTSSPAGINCGSTCSADYSYGTSVTLTAAPATGSDFTGWNGGGCSGTSTTCTVTMDQARSVEANFVLEKRTLSATKSGSGSGSLTSDPSGLDCGSTCSKDFDFGTSVTITANPAAGSDFVEWGPGACASSGTSPTCTVTMDQARSVEGQFALEKRTLNVSKSGNGSGTVTSEPAGVDCGSTCSADYDYGTSVTLTASASPNSDFGGWSGACARSSTTCTVTMDEARNVEAGFGLQKRALSVTKDGGGSGSVTSSPGGIDCGATCSADYDHGTTVTLSATPATNSDFTGWDGACGGVSTCTVEMDQARSVKATFAPEQPTSGGRSATGSDDPWSLAGDDPWPLAAPVTPSSAPADPERASARVRLRRGVLAVKGKVSGASSGRVRVTVRYTAGGRKRKLVRTTRVASGAFAFSAKVPRGARAVRVSATFLG